MQGVPRAGGLPQHRLVILPVPVVPRLCTVRLVDVAWHPVPRIPCKAALADDVGSSARVTLRGLRNQNMELLNPV